jgi:hypothetical protein
MRPSWVPQEVWRELQILLQWQEEFPTTDKDVLKAQAMWKRELEMRLKLLTARNQA